MIDCKTDKRAPHGFNRNASHNEGRYVCECESCEPPVSCRICQDGIDPTKGKRMGRALIHCEDCGRDLTLAAIMLADAIVNSTEDRA